MEDKNFLVLKSLFFWFHHSFEPMLQRKLEKMGVETGFTWKGRLWCYSGATCWITWQWTDSLGQTRSFHISDPALATTAASKLMPAGILCFSLIKETLNTFLKGTLLTKTDFLKHKEMVGLTSLRRDSMPVFHRMIQFLMGQSSVQSLDISSKTVGDSVLYLCMWLSYIKHYLQQTNWYNVDINQ